MPEKSYISITYEEGEKIFEEIIQHWHRWQALNRQEKSRYQGPIPPEKPLRPIKRCGLNDLN